MKSKERAQMCNYVKSFIEKIPGVEIKNVEENAIVGYNKELESYFGIAIHNYKRTEDEFKELIRNTKNTGVHLINIFYKNGEDFFVRLAENEAWRQDKSLKKYTEEQINKMLHMRNLEKTALGACGNPMLYYQPKTERLDESLRAFNFGPVILDYSHLPENDPKRIYAHNKVSKIYKLPGEIAITDPANLLFQR